MTFMKATKISDIPPGHVKVVEVGYEDVALCNIDGEIFAIADLCTHDDGPLGEGHLHDGQIECPRHGARFDVRTGAALTLPAIVPIPTFDVKIEGDNIFVDIDT